MILKGKLKMILDIMETGPMPVNTYILQDEISKEAIVIDVGGDFEKIKQLTENKGYEIKYILNTHGHFDHVLGEIYVRKNYPNLPIYISKNDLSHIEKLKDEIKYFGFSASDTPLVLDKFIDESSELYIGKHKIQVIETPGHSKGGLSFYTDGKLFAGDSLFYRSIGRTDFYDGDFDTLISSIKNKLFVRPDDTIVYPGHGPSTTIKDEKKFNEYLTE